MKEPQSAPAQSATRISRRTVLKWFAAAAAATQAPEFPAPAQAAVAPPAKGYGGDPKLSKFYEPGEVWPLTLTAAERATTRALADLILPADHLGPAASEVRVPDYLDEWVSAPYPVQQADRNVIVPGLAWIDEEAQKRFSLKFAALSHEQQCAIADDICLLAKARPEHRKGAAFFQKFRALAASAYYGTAAGWKALGYVGNVPLVSFEGPPPEVLERLGVEQTVK